MGALDRFKHKAEELLEKSRPMAGTLKDKAERATESLKSKANEFDGLPHPAKPDAGPAAPDASTDAPESGPADPNV